MAYTDIIVKFDWSYGHNEYRIPETTERLAPFRDQRPRVIQVEFESGRIYSNWLVPYDEMKHYNHPKVSLSFRWGFGHSLDVVPGTTNLVDYKNEVPQKLLVLFEENLKYQGEFIDPLPDTKLLIKLERELDEPIWKHLKENPELVNANV